MLLMILVVLLVLLFISLPVAAALGYLALFLDAFYNRDSPDGTFPAR